MTIKDLFKRLTVLLMVKLLERKYTTYDIELITVKKAFDGFYAVCTNLEDDTYEIVKDMFQLILVMIYR